MEQGFEGLYPAVIPPQTTNKTIYYIVVKNELRVSIFPEGGWGRTDGCSKCRHKRGRSIDPAAEDGECGSIRGRNRSRAEITGVANEGKARNRKSWGGREEQKLFSDLPACEQLICVPLNDIL